MYIKYAVVLLLGLLTGISGYSQTNTKRITVSIPTIEQEASSIWRTIYDIEFLEEQGYEIALPEAPLIDSLIVKSKSRTFGNEDFRPIYQLLESGVYNTKDYQVAVERVNQQVALVHSVLQDIESRKDSWDWTFQLYESYPIVFTRYGSGGSYNPETGTVTLFTTEAGTFKRYQNPANTIIHEITHLGMEQSIVQKHQLPHGLKERLIDRFVLVHFGTLLPNYKMQDMGDTEIDSLLSKKADFTKLDSILEQILAK